MEVLWWRDCSHPWYPLQDPTRIKLYLYKKRQIAPHCLTSIYTGTHQSNIFVKCTVLVSFIVENNNPNGKQENNPKVQAFKKWLKCKKVKSNTFLRQAVNTNTAKVIKIKMNGQIQNRWTHVLSFCTVMLLSTSTMLYIWVKYYTVLVIQQYNFFQLWYDTQFCHLE